AIRAQREGAMRSRLYTLPSRDKAFGVWLGARVWAHLGASTTRSLFGLAVVGQHAEQRPHLADGAGGKPSLPDQTPRFTRQLRPEERHDWRAPPPAGASRRDQATPPASSGSERAGCRQRAGASGEHPTRSGTIRTRWTSSATTKAPEPAPTSSARRRARAPPCRAPRARRERTTAPCARRRAPPRASACSTLRRPSAASCSGRSRASRSPPAPSTIG